MPVRRNSGGWFFGRPIAIEVPVHYLINMTKKLHTGRLYHDCLCNDWPVTAVLPRARPGAAVSMPINCTLVKAGLDPGSYTVLSEQFLLAPPKALVGNRISERPLAERLGG